MPADALPDVNTIYITYRREVLIALRSENYTLAPGYLQDINAALPEKYQVEISNTTYEKMTKEKLKAICKNCKSTCNHCNNNDDVNCKAEVEYEELKIVDLLLDDFETFISGKKYEKVWFCPKCKSKNQVSSTNFEKHVPKLPYYLQVVPNPPEKKDGLVNRKTYPKKMKHWIETFLIELEHQMAKYRTEYVPKAERNEEDNLEETAEDLTEYV